MTKEKLAKFHENTIREVDYYAIKNSMSSEELISRIQSETVGCDTYSNPSDKTYLVISEKYALPFDVAKHFFNLT